MTATRIDTDVCVVGGGPAGLVLALALATRGDRVVVLERSQDFERSFRGESLSPDSVLLLTRLGIMERLRAQRVLDVHHIEVADGGEVVLGVDFDDFDPDRLPIEVPQPMLLRALAESASTHDNFTLLRKASGTGLLTEDGRVTGVQATTADGEVEVRARLTVGADGRYSNVRDWAGLAWRKVPMARDFLWFTVPCPPAWSNDTYRLRIDGDQHVMCIPTYPDLVRVGFNIPKNGLKAIRAGGIGALHGRIDLLAPELSDEVRRRIVDWSDTAMLDIFTSVVPTWSTPGLVLVGDAAHTLSPALAQGVNNAIVDGVTLAPLISHALHNSRPDDALDQACTAFQQLREPQVDRARMLQWRQEKLFTWSKPLARIVRRTLYRLIDHVPAVKRRIWRDLYYTLPPDTAVKATRSQSPARSEQE